MEYRGVDFEIAEDMALIVDGAPVAYTHDDETDEYLADYVVSDSLEELARTLIDVRLDVDD